MLQNFTLGTFSQGASGGGGAFESIASATGTGSSATITFSSIPSTYQSLHIRGAFFATSAGSVDITLNGVTGTSYARHILSGNGSTVAASGAASLAGITDLFQSGMSSTNACVALIDIHDYTSTTRNKTVRVINANDYNNTDGRIALLSGLFMNTNAVSSITFTSTSGNFTTNTQVALYGIKGA